MNQSLKSWKHQLYRIAFNAQPHNNMEYIRSCVRGETMNWKRIQKRTWKNMKKQGEFDDKKD